MRADSGLKNPVVIHIFVQIGVFLALLAATLLVAQSLELSVVATIAATVLPATVIILISVGYSMAILKQRSRRASVVANNPGATVVSAEWNSGVLAPFLRGTNSTHSSYRGFGVEIAADEDGVSIWRGHTKGGALLLGKLSWSQIDSVESGTVKAMIGSRVAPTVKILVRPGANSPFVDEIELIVPRMPIEEALSALRPPPS
jgi:hypothetical protein